MISSHIFRAYDIRGIYKQDLSEKTAELIGRGFGTYLGGGRRVVVGRDARIHSESLSEAFIRGLVSTGCDVVDIGLSPTPLLYFSSIEGKFDAGCNITASHNPSEYNGFKLVGKDGHSICGDEIQSILKIIQDGDFIEGAGRKQEGDFLEAYVDKLSQMFSFSKTYKIAIDSANGITGAFYPKIMERLGLSVTGLYTKLDGNFPNHEPDPIVEKNTEELKKSVLKESCDLGISFDGDGDRLSIIDDSGAFHTADETGMLLIRDVLTRHPDANIILTVSISESVFDDIREHGGRPLMCPVGHSFVEQAMHEHNSIFGLEQSGHIFIRENYFGYDDALVAALSVIALLDRTKQKLSVLYSDLPHSFIHPEIRPYCADDIKFRVTEQIKQYFSANYECNTIDGVRIDFGDRAWAGIRVSNTSPRLSICLDAPTKERLAEIKGIVMKHLESYEEIDWEK